MVNVDNRLVKRRASGNNYHTAAEVVEVCADGSFFEGGCAWRVTDLEGCELFESPRYEGGSSNIAEFLGIVQALRMIPSSGVVWTDSKIAMRWVYLKRARTWMLNNPELTFLIEEAEEWLRWNWHAKVKFWNRNYRGEIPADFGLK